MNAKDYKVGQQVNALVYPGVEIIGTIVEIEDHMVTIKSDAVNQQVAGTHYTTALSMLTPEPLR